MLCKHAIYVQINRLFLLFLNGFNIARLGHNYRTIVQIRILGVRSSYGKKTEKRFYSFTSFSTDLQ
jgi:hypothetical protein